MANPMLRRSGEIIKKAFLDSTSDYTSSIRQTGNEVASGIATVREQVSKYHLNPRFILRNFKISYIHRNLSEWFYGKAEEANDRGNDDDDFDSSALGDGFSGSGDAEAETSVNINAVDKKSVKKLNNSIVSSMHGIAAKQYEANLTNTAEIVSTMGSIYKVMENDYLNPFKQSLSSIENYAKKIYEGSSAYHYSQQNSGSSEVASSEDRATLMNSDGLINIGSLINEGFKSVIDSIEGISFNPEELKELFSPERLLSSAMQKGFSTIKVGERSLDEWGQGFNELFKQMSQSIASEIMFGLDRSRGIDSLHLTSDTYRATIKNDYTKDAATFDMMTRKTIVEIIPDYLKKITESLTGQSYAVDSYGKLSTSVTDRFKDEVQGTINDFSLKMSYTTFKQLAGETSARNFEASDDDFKEACQEMLRWMVYEMFKNRVRMLDYNIARNLTAYTVTVGDSTELFPEFVAKKLTAKYGNRGVKNLDFWRDVCETIAIRLSGNMSECTEFVQSCNTSLKKLDDTGNRMVKDYNIGGTITFEDFDTAMMTESNSNTSAVAASASSSVGSSNSIRSSIETLKGIESNTKDIFDILNRGINVRIDGDGRYGSFKRRKAMSVSVMDSVADTEINLPTLNTPSSGSTSTTSDSSSGSSTAEGSSSSSSNDATATKPKSSRSELSKKEQHARDAASELREKLGTVFTSLTNPEKFIAGGIGKIAEKADSAIFGKATTNAEGEKVREGGAVNFVANSAKQFASDIGLTDLVDRGVEKGKEIGGKAFSKGKDFAENTYNKAHNKALDAATNVEIANLRAHSKLKFGGTSDNIYAQEALSLMQIGLMDGNGEEDIQSVQKVIDKIDDPELKSSLSEQVSTMMKRNESKGEHQVVSKHSKNPIIGLLGAGLTAVVRPITTGIRSLLSVILGLGRKLIKLVTKLVVGGAKNVLQGGARVVSGAFGLVTSPLVAGVKSIGGGISTKIKQGLTGTKDTGDVLEKAYRAKLDQISNSSKGVTKFFKKLGVKANSFFSGLFDGSWFGKIFKKQGNDGKQKNNPFSSGFMEGLYGKKPSAAELSKSAPTTKVESDLQDASSSLHEILNSVNTIAEGMKGSSEEGAGGSSSDATAATSADVSATTSEAEAANSTSEGNDSSDATASGSGTTGGSSSEATAESSSTETSSGTSAVAESSTGATAQEAASSGDEESGKSGGLKGAAKSVGSKALSGIGKMLGGTLRVIIGISKMFLGVITGMAAFKTLTKLVKKMMNDGIQPLKRGFEAIINGIKPFLPMLTAIIKIVAGTISDIVESIVNTIAPLLKALLPVIGTIVETLTGQLSDILVDVFGGVLAPALIDAMPIITGGLNILVKVVKGISGALEWGLGKILEGVARILYAMNKEDLGKQVLESSVSLVAKGTKNFKEALSSGSVLSSALSSYDLIDKAMAKTGNTEDKITKSFNGSPLDGTNVLVGNGDFKQSNFGTAMASHGCGPAALANMYEVSRGGHLSPLDVAGMFGNGDYTSMGMSVGGYINAARALGMNLTPGGVTRGSLRSASMLSPITLLGSGQGFGTSDGNNHFINVYGSDGGSAIIANPITGRYERKPVSSLLSGSILGLYGNGDEQIKVTENNYQQILDQKDAEYRKQYPDVYKILDKYESDIEKLNTLISNFDKVSDAAAADSDNSFLDKLIKSPLEIGMDMVTVWNKLDAQGELNKLLNDREIELTSKGWGYDNYKEAIKNDKVYQEAKKMQERYAGLGGEIKTVIKPITDHISDLTNGKAFDRDKELIEGQYSENGDATVEANTDASGGSSIFTFLNQLKTMAEGFINLFLGEDEEGGTAEELDAELKDLFSDNEEMYNRMAEKAREAWTTANPQRASETDAEYEARFQAAKPSLMVRMFSDAIKEQKRYKEGLIAGVQSGANMYSKGQFVADSGAVLATNYTPTYTDVDALDRYNNNPDWSQHSPIHEFFMHTIKDDTVHSQNCNWYKFYCHPNKEGVGSDGGDHGGIDIHTANDDKPGVDTPLYATTDGEVTYVGYQAAPGGGHFISWKDVGGLVHSYMHLREQPKLNKGDKVVGGSTLMGYMGATGTTNDVWHLHYQIKDANGNTYNPLTYFKYNPNYRSSVTDAGPKATDIPAGFTPTFEVDKKYAQPIWDALLANGWTSVAAAGLMGNLQAESRLRPNNLEDSKNTSFRMTDEDYTQRINDNDYSLNSFMYDGGGYGLAQWTSSDRKEKLYNYMVTNTTPFDISNIDGQIGYLLSETMAPGAYGGLDDMVLVNPKNDHSNLDKDWQSKISTFSDWILEEFENPLVQDSSVYNHRRNNSWTIYKAMTGNGDTSIPPLDPSKYEDLFRSTGLDKFNQQNSPNNIFLSRVQTKASDFAEITNKTFKVESESIEKLLNEIITKMDNISGNKSSGESLNMPSNEKVFSDEIPETVSRLYR